MIVSAPSFIVVVIQVGNRIRMIALRLGEDCGLAVGMMPLAPFA